MLLKGRLNHDVTFYFMLVNSYEFPDSSENILNFENRFRLAYISFHSFKYSENKDIIKIKIKPL